MALLRRSNQRGRALARRFPAKHVVIRFGVWAAVLLGAGLLLALFAVGLEKLFYSRNPHFTLRDVDVRQAKGSLEPDFIERKLALVPGEDNIYDLDLEDLRRKLLQDPIIQEAEVCRVLPDKLEVTVYGRTPVAQLVRRGGLLIDANGYVMAPGTKEEMLNLPVIVGAGEAVAAREGIQVQDPDLRTALDFLALKARINNGNWLDVQFIQCNPQHGQLIVYLRQNKECYLLPGARLVLPTRNLKDALVNSLQILQVRSLAHQPTGQILAIYDRIPVLPYRP